MNVKYLGYTSFKISFKGVDIITDPLRTVEAGYKFSANTGDVVLFTGDEYLGKEDILKEAGFEKIGVSNRESLFEINNPGDYEIGGVLIRRFDGTNTYVIAKGDMRIVYVGATGSKIDVDQFKKIEGDIDVLIVPVGNGQGSIAYEKIEKIVSYVDPTYLIPSTFRFEGAVTELAEINSVDDFVKSFGYTHVRTEKALKVVKGTVENKTIEVVILQ